jgi:RNA polymerase sigma-70 factor (ECF subfamily)
MTHDPDPDTELLARIEAAVQALPRQRREVFLALRVHAMNYAEIAQATGLSVKQVERHVARAIAHIDRHLQRGEASPRPWWRRLLRR